jgi:crotonobetainyl-CoA:carnitine CoA-transferase CaiB-like acyl-CoA transferase
LPDLSADPRFHANPDRVSNCEALEQRINAVLRTKPVAYWSALLDRHDVANGPLQNAAQVMEDRQVEPWGCWKKSRSMARRWLCCPVYPSDFRKTSPPSRVRRRARASTPVRSFVRRDMLTRKSKLCSITMSADEGAGGNRRGALSEHNRSGY